jgi:Asp-tRNA(Asn)/Glu-tRNA(Gln) amidotransferase A subunit family amidase
MHAVCVDGQFSWLSAISCPVGYAPGEGGDTPVGLMGMGEWGSEEQLLQFGKDGEGILGEEGVRRLRGKGKWVDVTGLAATEVRGD